MHDSDDDLPVSRRRLLRASAGMVALSGVGSARADGGPTVAPRLGQDCPDATLEPGRTPCEGTSTDGCVDDHPVTVDFRSTVAEHVETRFPDVDALVDAGFKPY